MLKTRVFRDLSKDRRVGNPILIKTTYDEDELDKLPDVREVQDPNQLRSSLNPAEDARRRKRISDAPTASSIYTEPSPRFRYGFEMDPPVMPLFSQPTDAMQPSVSRIPAPTFGNSVPSKRISAGPIRRKQLPPTAAPESTPSPPAVQSTPTSFAERAAKAGITGLGTSPAELRPAWNGASGKSALMTPIADLPSVASGSTGRGSYHSGDGVNHGAPSHRSRSRSPMISPLSEEFHLARESRDQTWRERFRSTSRSVSPTVSPTSEHGESSSKPWNDQGHRARSIFDATQSQLSSSKQATPDQLYKFSSPVKNIINNGTQHDPKRVPTQPSDSTLRPYATSPTSTDQLPAEPSTPLAQQQAAFEPSSPINRVSFETPQRDPRSRFSWTTYDASTWGTPQAAQSEEPPVPMRQRVNSTPEAQPKSRFSWTTHDTSPQPTPPRTESSRLRAYTADQSDLGDFTPPPLAGQVITSPIMSRRRPFPPSSPKRKPVPAATITTVSNWRKGSMDASPMSFEEAKSKPLPTTPAVLDSVDSVTAIEAQITDLKNRRHNLEKVINSMTDPLQTSSGTGNPMVIDLERRRQLKDRVQGLNDELCEVKREEHELGLKLHRAWKRRDKGVEPNTMLWIRRVTG